MLKNRLVLIDSFALIYRAFYGIPPTLTRDGHPINAAYGFASAILAAIKDLQPEYLVACFDLPKKTKRHEDYVEYKAHRKPMPDDLVPQIQYCKKILEAMNIPIVSAEGYEGEDVIATIVAQIRRSNGEIQKNIEAIIVTGDSDTFQLVDGLTKVYSMARGAQHALMYDENKVQARYGLPPADFVDFKALKGDTSDNIPGVPGIGEKTAAKLIQEYNNLENIYENIEKIKGKLQTLLIENKEQAFLSRKLSQIVSNAPIEFELKTSRIHDFDQAKVEKLFLDLGFKSLLVRMPVSTRTNDQQTLF
ncbi:MAG: 5'-3' exonuclease H3TH domain-containing protein [Candidatus Berkelbacteria bacterium]